MPTSEEITLFSVSPRDLLDQCGRADHIRSRSICLQEMLERPSIVCMPFVFTNLHVVCRLRLLLFLEFLYQDCSFGFGTYFDRYFNYFILKFQNLCKTLGIFQWT